MIYREKISELEKRIEDLSALEIKNNELRNIIKSNMPYMRLKCLSLSLMSIFTIIVLFGSYTNYQIINFDWGTATIISSILLYILSKIMEKSSVK